MARLPTPGGDDGTWGSVLNTYLGVEHNSDGTHNYSAVGGGVLLSGSLASRPVASVSNTNLYYFATDTNGGTLYRSNGSSWAQLAKGVSEAPMAHATSHGSGGSDAITVVESQVTNLTTDLAGKVPLSTVTTKGDLITATGTGAVTRLAASTNGYAVTADSTQTGGLAYRRVPGYLRGTLAGRPAANTVLADTLYFATDQNGGTVYESDGTSWNQVGAGVLTPNAGRLGSVKNTVSLNQSITSSVSDLPGMTVTFTYNGKPVQIVLQLTWLKSSTVSDPISVRIVDATGSGATNGKTFYQEQVTSPASATQFFKISFTTDALTAAADGTAMTSGQAYTFKVSAFASSTTTLTSTWAANSAFYAHMSVYEVG